MWRESYNSDHFTEYMDIDMKIVSEKPERIEFFNFKDEQSQNNFRKSTSETEDFTNCFLDDGPLEVQIENWRRVLNSHCKEVFKKIRIRKKKIKPIKSSIANLINERNRIIANPENKDKIDSINNEISEKEAEENRNIIVHNFKQFSDNSETINMQQMWKLLKNLWPKSTAILPTAFL